MGGERRNDRGLGYFWSSCWKDWKSLEGTETLALLSRDGRGREKKKSTGRAAKKSYTVGKTGPKERDVEMNKRRPEDLTQPSRRGLGEIRGFEESSASCTGKRREYLSHKIMLNLYHFILVFNNCICGINTIHCFLMFTN